MCLANGSISFEIFYIHIIIMKYIIYLRLRCQTAERICTIGRCCIHCSSSHDSRKRLDGIQIILLPASICARSTWNIRKQLLIETVIFQAIRAALTTSDLLAFPVWEPCLSPVVVRQSWNSIRTIYGDIKDLNQTDIITFRLSIIKHTI